MNVTTSYRVITAIYNLSGRVYVCLPTFVHQACAFNYEIFTTAYLPVVTHFSPGTIIAYLYSMKKVFIPLLLLLSIAAVALPQKKKAKKAKQKETITKVEFETFTRGNRAEVTITKDSAISIGTREKKYIVMSAAKWNELCVALKKVSLSSIPVWEAPTKAREYDGAAHCRIMVSTKNKTYESKYFDSGQPMKQLQALYDVIDSLRNTISEEGKEYAE